MIREVAVEFHTEDSVSKLKKKAKKWSDFCREASGGLLSRHSGELVQPCAGSALLAMCLWPFFSASGLPSGCRGLPSPAVFSLQWRSVPGTLLWMASTVQRPCRPLRAQVSGPGTKLGGGAGTQSPGWDTVHCWLLGMCISGICQVSHTCFPGPCLQPVLQPLSVKITFLFCTSVHADEILPLRILM